MRSVDEKLRAAASEVRQVAARHQFETTPDRRPSDFPRWVAFVGAFAVVAALFVVPGLLAGVGNDEPSVGTQPLATPGSTPLTTAGIAPTSTQAAGSCSASNASAPAPADDLPPAVAETRRAIVEAALTCDLDVLVQLAGPGFVTSFGGGDALNLRLWEQEGEGRLDVLLAILDMSHEVVTGDDHSIYVWPSASARDAWDDITPEEIEELYRIYTESELDELARLGVYGGWRTGISEDGDWLYFVAGD